jgi:hypothetical protein
MEVAARRLTGYKASYSTLRLACPFLVMRSPDILIIRCMASDIATALYYTGIEPFTKKEAHVAKGLRDSKVQRALMQILKPKTWFTVREALIQAGGQDLIGSGCDCLIPAQPPREAVGRAGVGPMTRPITTASPTRQRARSLESGVCRTRATDRGGRRRAARTRNASGTAANQVCGRSQRANKN